MTLAITTEELVNIDSYLSSKMDDLFTSTADNDEYIEFIEYLNDIRDLIFSK